MICEGNRNEAEKTHLHLNLLVQFPSFVSLSCVLCVDSHLLRGKAVSLYLGLVGQQCVSGELLLPSRAVPPPCPRPPPQPSEDRNGAEQCPLITGGRDGFSLRSQGMQLSSTIVLLSD